jgi:hypothetical protein
MSSAFDVKTVVTSVGTLNNATRPLFEVPADGGGITVINGDVVMAAAGTLALQLVTMQGGTLINGTIGVFPGTLTLNAPAALTISSDWVDGGYWVGLKEANVGTSNAATLISMSYVLGR